MRVIYQIPTLEKVLETTLWTQTDGITPYWRDPLYQKYPEIDRQLVLSLPWEKRRQYLTEKLAQIYQRKLLIIKETAKRWQQLWQKNEQKVLDDFSQAFEIDVHPFLNDITGYPNLNPVSPRYLTEHSFYIPFFEKDKYAFKTSLHEIIHFVWFTLWQDFFHDNSQEYDSPHLKWIYSEMVADTFSNHSQLKEFFGRGKHAYSYFYTMRIDGKCPLDILADIYKKQGIKGLFTDGFSYIQRNEEKIREHIEQSENF